MKKSNVKQRLAEIHFSIYSKSLESNHATFATKRFLIALTVIALEKNLNDKSRGPGSDCRLALTRGRALTFSRRKSIYIQEFRSHFLHSEEASSGLARWPSEQVTSTAAASNQVFCCLACRVYIFILQLFLNSVLY